MAWLADQVQVVIFAIPSTAVPDAARIWGLLSGGASPDAFQRNSSLPVAMSTAQGAWNGMAMTVQAQLGRVDVFLRALSPDFEGAPPPLADLRKATMAASELLLELTGSVHPMRIALVAQLRRSMGSLEDSAAELKKELSNVEFPQGAIDPMYQFNVRRRYFSAPYEMNRLCSWGAGSLQLMEVNSAFGAQGLTIKSYPQLTLKIDINSATQEPIQGTQLSAMISEMAEEIILISDDYRKVLFS